MVRGQCRGGGRWERGGAHSRSDVVQNSTKGLGKWRVKLLYAYTCIKQIPKYTVEVGGRFFNAGERSYK